MVRNYKTKTNRRPYSDEHLSEALDEIRTKQLSTKRCSKFSNIPRETLKDHISGKRGRPKAPVGGGGRSAVLSVDQEKELAKFINCYEQKCR